jgi:glycosyltransferase involved in cell wall biosynthesis
MEDDAAALSGTLDRHATISVSGTTTSKPRVLHVLTLYRPTFTGDGLYWEKFWPHLAAIGGIHDFLVVETPRPQEEVVTAPRQARLIYLSRTPPERRARKILELELWLLRNLHRYDILHAHSHIDRFFAGHWLARLLKVPVIYSATLDDTPGMLINSYSRLLRPYARFMLRRLDHMITLCNQLSEDAIYDLGTERVSEIPNGVLCPPAKRTRAEMRQHMRIPENALVLLTIGGICRRKAQHLLIENHSRLANDEQPCHLLLVGPDVETGYAAEMRALVEQHGIANRVHFAGYSDDPSSFYDMADIFVFPSTGEGFGNVIAEAMYMGLPVVSRLLPGTTDFFINNGETGFLFEDEADYRKYVELLADDSKLRSSIGRAGQRWARRELSMPTLAKRYQNVYDRLAGLK